MRTPEISHAQRRSAINSAIGNSLTVVPILVYQVLLADKLDKELSWPYTVISIPLFMGLFALILLSFNAKGGNKCKFYQNSNSILAKCRHLMDSFFSFSGWFGIRKSFSQFLLSSLPCLQEYGNIGYHSTRNHSAPLDPSTHIDGYETDIAAHHKSKDKLKKGDQMKPVVPIISIDLPD